MQINILGYIEDLHRIGKNTNNHRPLVIELLSKRIAKFITANRQCLQGTRIYISEFLDDIALKKRHLLRAEMIKARNRGQNAIIKNNQLLIEGNKVTIEDEENNTHNNYQTTEITESPSKSGTLEISHDITLSQQVQQRNNSKKYSFRKSTRPTL
ncbi:unnamed protein product [Arctia plantaginis]|uniref:Uncharacterized protein n=1 Tax=Arctia plantaginis TaxID=874455 RepID=A0A8S1BC82_ARCPL|nr:unnamed protein product [Arctia plantaginis]